MGDYHGSAYQLPLEKICCCSVEEKIIVPEDRETSPDNCGEHDAACFRAALERSEAQLRERSAEIEAIFESAAVGLCTLDKDLRFTRVNRKLAEMNGVSIDDHLGRRLDEVLPSLAARGEDIFRAVVRTGEPVLNVEVSGNTKADDGSEHRWIGQWYPVKNACGEVTAVTVGVEDVTAIVRLQSESASAERRKDEFLSILAHELRNPLASISAGLNLLCHPGTTGEKSAFIKKTLSQRVQQLARLIDDLLDISRISRGKVSLNKERIALSIVVERVVDVVRKTMEERNQALTVSVDESLFVYADPSRIEQVLVNMLINAAKYTDECGKIEVTGVREGDMAVVRIKDNGVGILPEMRSRIFELLEHGDIYLHGRSGEPGLGLPLVRKLAEMHGGTVDASSDGPGRGSEFRLQLPLIAIST